MAWGSWGGLALQIFCERGDFVLQGFDVEEVGVGFAMVGETGVGFHKGDGLADIGEFALPDGTGFVIGFEGAGSREIFFTHGRESPCVEAVGVVGADEMSAYHFGAA